MNAIAKSITKYYETIMSDINAVARIIVQGKENKTYITTIIDWKDDKITFHAPLILGDYVRLLHNQTYSFVIVTKACIYTTSVKITDFSKNKQNHFFYSATISSPLERNQQRQHFRLEWVTPIKYTVSESTGWEKATILDISAGGLRMAAKQKISRNDSIHLEMTLLTTTLILDGVVLDELEKNQADLYVYRIQFHSVSQTTENLLSQLIMRRQRDMLKRQ